jgi:hypothetical protein
MGDKISPEEAELLRKALLEYLGSRHPLKWSKRQIIQGIKMRGLVDFLFSDEDMASAIAVLQGKKWLESEREELGMSIYYGASADGLIEWERRH